MLESGRANSSSDKKKKKERVKAPNIPKNPVKWKFQHQCLLSKKCILSRRCIHLGAFNVLSEVSAIAIQSIISIKLNNCLTKIDLILLLSMS